MTLIRWNPFRELEDLLERYNRYPTDRKGDRSDDGAMAPADWQPAVDIHETPKSYQIRLDLPAVNPKDVRISVKSGMLTISGQREQVEEHKEGKTHRVERHFGRFVRSFTLPEDADQENIEATSKNGELSLSVAKKAVEGSRAIDIKVT